MAELTGRVLIASDPGWDGARKGFAAWAPYDDNVPRYIVFCQDVHDVANAISYAKENHLPFRVRSGRHNYEAYSSLVKDGLIIDVSDIDFVRFDREGMTATVGSGLDSLELFEALGSFGVTLPLATGPSVGVAGLVLGGGFGVTSRKWGLTCDNLIALEIVTADGAIRQVSADADPDLFWACRGGGGGNFGVATSFEYELHPVGPMVTGGIIAHPFDRARDVLKFFRESTASLPDDHVLFGGLIHAPDGSGTKLVALVTMMLTFGSLR